MKIYNIFLSIPMDGKHESEIDYIENCWIEARNSNKVNIIRSKKLGELIIENCSNISNTAKTIVEFDLQLLRSCDGLILDFSFENHLYIGSICEMVYAYQLNMPVIIYSGHRIFDKRWWLIYHAKHISPSRESCITLMLKEVSLIK